MTNLDKHNFLIIDDDELFTHKLKELIQNFSEKVTSSKTAENGSHFAQTLRPAIIFLDNNLPRLNGIDVIELYKEISPKSKVVLMSSEMEMDEIEMAIQNKADYIIDKTNINKKSIEFLLKGSFLAEKKNSSIWELLNVYEQKSVRKINISVIEDDELFSTHLCHSIDKICTNAKIKAYTSGEKFFEDIKDHQSDLVFLDYYLQDTNGKEVLTKIINVLPNAKVIVISSLEDPKIATELLNQGIDGYIVKNEEWKSNLEIYLDEFGFN